MREIVARAPTRIDLGGGWTDVPPYCDREGGFVCNVAITRHAVVHLRERGPIQASDMPLVRAALRRTGVTDVDVSIDNDFPVGAGLGGSSAASAALLGALAVWRGVDWDRPTVAEDGRRIEVEDLGVAGGRQDHYAAAFGGALGLTFSTTTSVRRIPLDERIRSELVRRSVLVYTGESRISGDTITSVLESYERGEPLVLNALARMKKLAREMANDLERGDLDALGAELGEHWEFQRSLHPSIPTARIDEIIALARRAGALGAKAMGASGGGCVLILCKRDGTPAVRNAIGALGEILEFRTDVEGLVTTERDCA